ncbi:helix-turn-helix domain-containing protein [Hyalangium versicolor]|uniref:helix-turn-helix domain-containing protein n=1 Tax=Hyalangium versicolor TaxID=2861190 RepID=UPI001CCA6232|nr:helix-turn-helix domain-containing protein [Hyalangium versicolor]
MAAELHLPRRLIRRVTPHPWLRIRSSDEASLRLDGKVFRLRLLPMPSGLRPEQLPLVLQSAQAWASADDDLPEIPVVIGSFLTRSLREALEKQDVSYLDSKGHLHLVAPGVLVHLEEGAKNPLKEAEKSGIGVHGVRTVQVLLEQTEPFSVSELAQRAAVSLGQAHNVLTKLEHVGLVNSFGSGPNKRRRVTERTALLDWLEQQPSATRWEPSLHVALYARRPEELWSRMTQKLTQAGVAHALTGAAAASLYGVGPTNVPLSPVRISPTVSLKQAAEELGAEVTDRGANLVLLRDTGEVGSKGAMTKDDVQVAPLVRIYLDARSARRGEDVAQQFREVVLGY